MRREKFIPLRLTLKDGRTIDMRRFGQFLLVPREITIRLPYDLDASTTRIEMVYINYDEVLSVSEHPELADVPLWQGVA